MNEFAHLHLHTEFSLLDGACQIDALVDQAAKFGMKSLAITDHGNMFGAVAFHDACRAKGVKPIVGCEVYVATGSRFDKNASGISEAYNHLTLLASDLEGYHNLVRLVSIGYTEGFYHRPRIDKEVLQKHNQGIVCLSGCLSSEVGVALRNGNEAEALRCVGEFGEIFDDGRFYLEIMEHGLEEQRRVTRALTRIHERTGLPLVATNDAHYLLKDDHQAHDVLLCIGTGKKVQDEQRFRFDSQEFFVKSAEEMSRVFPDHPEALANTLRVAERCDFTLQEVSTLPAFDVPSGFTTESYFEKVTRDGFAERRRVLEPLAEASRLRYPISVYAERLEKEIGVIRRVGFSGYFLIVWDFIRYAREKRVPVGPGRGSAAGSLVAYCLRITDIDPIEYDLIFERFLNEERISPPDIDIDFCEARRGEVIEYVTRKYGRENVAQIITFGTMKAKAVVRDVARAMDMSFGDADKIAKMIPFDLKMTLDKALEESAPLQEAYERDPKVKELIDISRRLEGTTRHASIHAAGVVISPQPLVELVPLFKSNTGDVTTQYDMKGVERIGLLKMDFLGLRTLTLIDNCVKMIEAQTGVRVDPDRLPTDDAKTYELFTAGKTSGLFQFESDGMRDILKRFKPAELEHLTALNALYRPGPMQMIDDFIKRRHGQTRVSFEHPRLETILKGTYGVMVYQEQVMQIASALAGFTLGEADILRKAMGKKKVDVMTTQKQKFLGGCAGNGVAEKKAAKIWDQMEQFAGYGFNKSHSAAYAWLAYQTGYLKANYPAYFMAALLTSERATTDKMVQYIGECREMSIKVLPPDVNQSDMFFTVVRGTPPAAEPAAAGAASGGPAPEAKQEQAKGAEFASLERTEIGGGAAPEAKQEQARGAEFASLERTEIGGGAAPEAKQEQARGAEFASLERTEIGGGAAPEAKQEQARGAEFASLERTEIGGGAAPEAKQEQASGAEFTSAERAGGLGGAAQPPPVQDDIRFGLAAIKNVGEGAVESVLRVREGQPFTTFYDFCDRIDPRALNRRVIESFIKSGCFDSLDARRASLFGAIDRGMEAGAKKQRDLEAGQSSLFGMLGGGEMASPTHERLPDAAAWGEGERLAFEKESLGFFITGHPLERYRAELAQWATCTTGGIGARDGAAEVTVGGIITGLRLLKTKKGDRMASFILEDLDGSAEVLVFPETYKKTQGRLADDEVVMVKGKAEATDDARARILATEVLPLEQAKMAEARFVTIRVPVSTWNRAKGERLRDILGAHRGDCPVTLELVRPGFFAAAVAPSGYYRVRPDSTLRTEVEALLGQGALVLARTGSHTVEGPRPPRVDA